MEVLGGEQLRDIERGTLIPTTGPFLYLLAQQCHITVILFDNGRHACMFLIGKIMSWESVLCMVTSAMYTVANILPIGISSYLVLLELRLSPAEPHFPILFPIVIQSEFFISFRK